MASKNTLGPFLRWLGIVGGVLAILTFLGVANYHQLSSALGIGSGPPHFNDTRDAGTCTAAQAIITKVNRDAPVGVTASMNFYISQSDAFGRIFYKYSNRALGHELTSVYVDLERLAEDWLNEDSGFYGSEQQKITDDMTSFRRNEVTLENWCRANTGVS